MKLRGIYLFLGLRLKLEVKYRIRSCTLLGAVYMAGGRSYYQEDPRRRQNFSFALHAEISAEVVTKWTGKEE